MKQQFEKRIKTLSLHMTGFFAPDAVASRLQPRGSLRNELLQYVQGNVDYAIQYLQEHLPDARLLPILKALTCCGSTAAA